MTAQIPERLLYEGQRLPLRTTPLAPYLAGKEHVFQPPNTANWRGYVGTWEITDDKLYLIELQGRLKDGSDATFATLFPNQDRKIFAKWYSGILQVPQGELLEYVHAGFASRYERELLFEIREGVLVDVSVKKNEPIGDDMHIPGKKASKGSWGLFPRLLKLIR
jgi:hypothetical protein